MTSFTADDLEATKIGGNAPPTPPTEAPKRRRSSVSPDEVSGGSESRRNQGGRPTQEQRKEKAEKEAAERAAKAREKVRVLIEAQVNPALAQISRVALQVPANVPWLDVKRDAEGAPVIVNSVPAYQYMNGAQLCVLQPFEIEMLQLVAPFVMDAPISDAFKEKAQMLLPVAVVGGCLALVVSYGVRVRQAKAILEPQLATIRLVAQHEAEIRSQQESRNGSGPLGAHSARPESEAGQ